MAQPFVGEIRMFAGNFAPNGWMLCDGQSLSIAENDTLFNLIGTTYGGDGQSTFNLPNLQSRIPLHQGTGPDGVTYQLGEAAGTEQVTLTTQQIPSHTHSLTGSTANASDPNPTGNVLATSTVVQPYAVESVAATFAPSTITPVGGSQPHENCQPFLCINYIISLFGIFPPPN
jgi:microcystin-dependent protein